MSIFDKTTIKLHDNRSRLVRLLKSIGFRFESEDMITEEYVLGNNQAIVLIWYDGQGATLYCGREKQNNIDALIKMLPDDDAEKIIYELDFIIRVFNRQTYIGG